MEKGVADAFEAGGVGVADAGVGPGGPDDKDGAVVPCDRGRALWLEESGRRAWERKNIFREYPETVSVSDKYKER